MQITPKNHSGFNRDAPEAQKCSKKRKAIKMGPHGVVWAIVGCKLGQKSAANLMEGMKQFKDSVTN